MYNLFVLLGFVSFVLFMFVYLFLTDQLSFSPFSFSVIHSFFAYFFVCLCLDFFLLTLPVSFSTTPAVPFLSLCPPLFSLCIIQVCPAESIV